MIRGRLHEPLGFRGVINDTTGRVLIGGTGYRRWLPAVCCHSNKAVHLGRSNRMKYALLCKLLATQQPSCPNMLSLFCISNAIMGNSATIWVTAWRWRNYCVRAFHHVVTSYSKPKISRMWHSIHSNYTQRYNSVSLLFFHFCCSTSRTCKTFPLWHTISQ